ncbi:divisome protein SepX/GlpR [Mycolicibacterium arseniciresistens]|uniref:Transmembrane protein n=1 Tax=Mycolicibacterium arseniciresistens TaxID=3062257 RepID=A0ABT8UC61_9MYCO|nr:gephyrin-like molybdotransferase receptor GlpR [Mycolicibacterium arseniciresistens]MDO3635376.1 hypothetical protein [Mycolicibacterium arseniciresistens]
MPSIPQSLLWISLVVLWLFVLVPMLISKRDAVRRTSDVALATRVLDTGRRSKLRRSGPAAGHNSDPDWQPDEDDLRDLGDHDGLDEQEARPQRAMVLAAAATTVDEPDYLDVDVVDEASGALPVGRSAIDEPELPLEFHAPEPVVAEAAADVAEAAEVDAVEDEAIEDEADDEEAIDDDAIEDEADDEETDEDQAVEAEADDEFDGTDDEYEYVADSSGLEAPSESDLHVADSMSAARRRRNESKTAAAVSARKYRFRMRMLVSMAVAIMASAAVAYLAAPWAWWLCATTGAVTLMYLMYLRRQTRIEERLRRRRAQRMMRSRLGVENAEDQKLDVVPARLRRPGAAVLEIDDEDPAFEHLDYTSFARHYDLPRAAGQ